MKSRDEHHERAFADSLLIGYTGPIIVTLIENGSSGTCTGMKGLL